MLLLEFLQLTQQAVVLGVGDLRVVEHVVAIVVMVQPLAQFARALRRMAAIAFRHARPRRLW
ncbi:MAG: hypothetical protein U5K33_10540 [Halofilum sp. (in: g-proteobacteria)]|nr:hypothetical protein [Halofilum sp. (in: g-proteobacteria)]